jgi:ATP-dependent exoDNAse (exonuclease V) beta subunit
MGYDVIMLDEAQDINPVISEILAAEVGSAGLIMVGDPHQQVSFE